jgi:polysaccharide export outer membrane protein
MSRNLIVVGLVGIALSAFGQQQTEEEQIRATQSLRSAPCDPADAQTADCDAPNTGQSFPTGMRNPPARVNDPSRELWRNSDPERYSKPRNLEDSQYERIVDPPTEFQKFVEASVGKRLPIYGATLFDRVPSTYAPVDQIPVGGDYAVGPGDELDIRVWGQINFEQKLVIDRTGEIFLPKVGLISVSGLKFNELPTALKTSIGRVFRNFEISVSMGRLRSIQVFVMGKARRPGTYTVSSLSTLVNALFISGGPSPQGSMRNIELKRGGQTVSRFDMYDLLLRGDKTRDIILNPGDVIFIPAAGAQVALAGSVESPAIYEIPQQHYSLREVLSDAGGLSPVAAGQQALLERVDSRATLVPQRVSLMGQGLETPLQDGDIIRVLDLVPRFTKTVSLKGNVADPVRLPWHEGMRVSDLIPEKQALLTRGYWTEHNRLQPAAPESQGFTEEVLNLGTDTSLASAIASDRNAKQRKFTQKTDLQPPAPEINWTYAAIERLDEQTLSTRLIPFNLGKAVLDHEEASDLLLQPGDVVSVFSQADFTTPVAEQSRIVRLEGEVKIAGIYSVRPGETLRQLVERAGGLTDKAYLYAAAFTRESTRREQQRQLNNYLDQTEKELDQNSATLAARSISSDQQAAFRTDLERQREVLERLRKTQASGRIVLDLKPESQGAHALPDLPLENADRLIVPGMPATVSVVGTVYNQSTFLYTADSSVHDYLKLSGGPTKFADASQMFVIRADGSVVARAKLSHFESIAVRPGDAVVVPSNSMKVSMIRNFLDWSQVLSGFGIAAAAVNVLK